MQGLGQQQTQTPVGTGTMDTEGRTDKGIEGERGEGTGRETVTHRHNYRGWSTVRGSGSRLWPNQGILLGLSQGGEQERESGTGSGSKDKCASGARAEDGNRAGPESGTET